VLRYAPPRGHGFGTARLRHDPYDDGLTALRMRLHMASAGRGTFGTFATAAIRPRRIPTGDHLPRALHFPGGQRKTKYLDLKDEDLLQALELAASCPNDEEIQLGAVEGP